MKITFTPATEEILIEALRPQAGGRRTGADFVTVCVLVADAKRLLESDIPDSVRRQVLEDFRLRRVAGWRDPISGETVE